MREGIRVLEDVSYMYTQEEGPPWDCPIWAPSMSRIGARAMLTLSAPDSLSALNSGADCAGIAA